MATLSFTFSPSPHEPDITDVLPVIDGRPVETCHLDFIALLAAEGLPAATFDLFTCSCGHAGCAGFVDPFVVTTEARSVAWTTTGDVAHLLGAATLTFDRAAYAAALASLRAELRRRVDQGATFVLLTDTEIDETDHEQVLRLDPAAQEARMRDFLADADRIGHARAELTGMTDTNQGESACSP